LPLNKLGWKGLPGTNSSLFRKSVNYGPKKFNTWFNIVSEAGVAEEEDDDDVPDLVENFDEASKGEEKVKSEGKNILRRILRKSCRIFNSSCSS
jgi:hypothetical protein